MPTTVQDVRTFHAPLSFIPSEAELFEAIVARSACGRIRDLHVECSEHLVVLTGRSRTYHAKQLAQQAILEKLDGRRTLANQIVVS